MMMDAFADDVARRTEVSLLEEESGSTFFIADILKIVIAPFVAVRPPLAYLPRSPDPRHSPHT